MLRIHRKRNGEVLYTIAGDLDIDNVLELSSLLAEESENVQISLDLRDVVLVDRYVVSFLGHCERCGITLNNCSSYMRASIDADQRKR